MKYRILYCGLLLVFVLTGAAAANGSIQTYLGDTVPLSGYSYTSSTVYLFLAGPNLPADGVALDNIYRRADQGGFTEVSVDSNNHWKYDWDTGSIGGRLNTGTYTVWAVDGPNDLSNLTQARSSPFRLLWAHLVSVISLVRLFPVARLSRLLSPARSTRTRSRTMPRWSSTGITRAGRRSCPPALLTARTW